MTTAVARTNVRGYRVGRTKALVVAFAVASAWPLCDERLLAEDAANGVSTLIADFSAGWDDTMWEPATGRISKYLRPGDDKGWVLRARTLQAVARKGQEAGPALRAVLTSGTAPARAFAAQALGFTGDAESKEDLAAAAEHDSDAIVRLYAVDSLGMLGGIEHEELLKRLEASEKNGEVKRHARYALEREGVPVAADVVATLSGWNPENAAVAKLGEAAPDFELQTVADEKIRLSDFRGKSAVVLVFVYGDT